MVPMRHYHEGRGFHVIRPDNSESKSDIEVLSVENIIGNTGVIEHLDPLLAGELRALVGVEDLRGTELGQRFLQRLDTKIRRQSVGEPEGRDFAGWRRPGWRPNTESRAPSAMTISPSVFPWPIRGSTHSEFRRG
jgi:hypothetical protein